MIINSLTDTEWDRLEKILGEDTANFLKDKYTDTLKGAIQFLYKETSISEDFNLPFNRIPFHLETRSPLKKSILLLRLEVGR